MNEKFNYFLERFLLLLGITSIMCLTIYGVIEHGVVVLLVMSILFGIPGVMALLMTLIKYRKHGDNDG